MYDSLSADYDYFVNWPERLKLELPFLEAWLATIDAGSDAGSVAGGRPKRVLDAACGTGMHAIELARRGYSVAGADLSAGMIERAAANARAAGVRVDFRVAGFGELAGTFSDFDALLCLGNSLPHILTLEELAAVLGDFFACLRPGGLVLVQNRNFDAVLASRERWMPPEGRQIGDQEWLFLRFYDFDQDGLITFHVVTLARQGETGWQQKDASTRLYPLRAEELVRIVEVAGFQQISRYGSLQGEPFDPLTSGNLVLTAFRPE
jgi:2-polyprenyl-3-methyl-5-hydroxy-6-metoxy-1,4-benzoquinol methylase